MMEYLNEFDKCVGIVKNNMDKKTLLMVTADHETGGIKYSTDINNDLYTTAGHTSTYVPYYLLTNDDITIDYFIDNTNVFKLLKDIIKAN